MKRLRRCACCLSLPALLVLSALGFWVWLQLQQASSSREPVSIVIQHGSSPRQVARILRRQGIIRSELAFLWVAAQRGSLGALRSGAYKLSGAMTLQEIVDRLRQGGSRSDERAVTIPEGYTLRQIAHALGGKGIVRDPAEFVAVAERGAKTLDAPFELPASGAEGYLYPQTYRFPPGSEPQKVAQAMLDMFVAAFYEPHRADIERSAHSLREIVTIASLVEREALVPRDRPAIAGVIENRLKRKMRLEIDATILYALGHHKPRVLYRDLDVRSPYNTYRHPGLPPGPIASPGLPALEAALFPQRHDYLFYVAGPDGSHLFTRSLAEHDRAIARARAHRPQQL